MERQETLQIHPERLTALFQLDQIFSKQPNFIPVDSIASFNLANTILNFGSSLVDGLGTRGEQTVKFGLREWPMGLLGRAGFAHVDGWTVRVVSRILVRWLLNLMEEDVIIVYRKISVQKHT